MVFEGKRTTSDPVEIALGKTVARKSLSVHGRGTFKLSKVAQVVRFGGDAYLPPTAYQVRVRSTESDDSETGTGARSVHISGLGMLGELISAEVPVPGVLDSTLFTHLQQARVCQAGTSMVNAGDVHVTLGDEPVVTIAAGEGVSSSCIYQCPRGHVTLVTACDLCCVQEKPGKSDPGTVDFLVCYRMPDGLLQTHYHMPLPIGLGVQHMSFDPPIVVKEGTTVWIAVRGAEKRNAPTVKLSATMSLLETIKSP